MDAKFIPHTLLKACIGQKTGYYDINLIDFDLNFNLIEVPYMSVTQLDAILDLNTLEQYISAIGAGTLLKSVVLFEQLMPEYVGSLVKAHDAGDKETLCSEAHKFKGAAGSVGLKRIQQFAQLLQHGEEAKWDAEHAVWLAGIVEHAERDLQQLKLFLEAKA